MAFAGLRFAFSVPMRVCGCVNRAKRMSNHAYGYVVPICVCMYMKIVLLKRAEEIRTFHLIISDDLENI